MHAASRDALDQTREALKSALAADPAGGATGAKVGQELFQVVDVLEDNRSLRVAVADTSAPVEARQEARRMISRSSVSRRFSALRRLISADSFEVVPERAPASTCACTAHRRTVSPPTPTCLAIASAAAVNDVYSPPWASSNRRALERTSGSISLGMSSSFLTQKEAASNLG